MTILAKLVNKQVIDVAYNVNIIQYTHSVVVVVVVGVLGLEAAKAVARICEML